MMCNPTLDVIVLHRMNNTFEELRQKAYRRFNCQRKACIHIRSKYTEIKSEPIRN